MANQVLCGPMIKQIHDEMEKRINNTLRPNSLTMVQMAVLLALRDVEDGQMPLKQVEQSLHVAQSTAAGIVARLEQKGLVVGFGDPNDRRIKMVRITPTGLDCCHEADEKMNEAERELLACLTEAEQSILQTLLEKINNSLK